MTAHELYREIQKIFCDNGTFKAAQLLRHFTGLDQLSDVPLPEAQISLITESAHRVASGYPLQYIIGEWNFYGLDFYIGEGVLIPRPETELLVEQAIKILNTIDSPAVCDLCAGSGCIAVSIAHSINTCRVLAIEKEYTALDYCRRNVSRNGVDNLVRVEYGDVLSGPGNIPPESFNMVISNPPYIKSGDIPALMSEVLFEPLIALDGGSDGLNFYRSIIEKWTPLLKRSGFILLETGYDQADAVSSMLCQSGYKDSAIISDYSGIQRIVSALKD